MEHEYDLEELLREFSDHGDEETPKAEIISESAPVEAQETVSPAASEPVYPIDEEPAVEPEPVPDLSLASDELDELDYDESDQTWDEEPDGKGRKIVNNVLMFFAAFVFFGVSLIALFWVVLNLHPDSGTATATAGNVKLNLASNMDIYMNNAASDALGDLTYIRKLYTIEESATAGQVPNPDGFGTTTDPAVIQAVIDDAWELLEGQDMIWSADADFVPGEPMRYYYDETILVIQWKEYIDNRCCTCAEVKIANGSQLRRKLADDTYGSSVQYYASELADMANSVIAINGDFYTFRNLGITAYQRQLYRNNPATVDSCFITASGDLLFSRAGELMGDGEAEKFIQDNDVVFTIAFGPVLVENGELQYCESYPIGEIDTQYSRSCIAQKGELHYFLMTINHTQEGNPRATINQLANYVYAKGVEQAYTLDGGQTSEIVMMGGPVNYVDYGNERPVSDIIYFATAIPSQEVSK
jgi:hypothetical protein